MIRENHAFFVGGYEVVDESSLSKELASAGEQQ